MSKINGIGIGVSYGNSSGTGGLLNSSTFFAPLKTSLILQRGTGGPTWSRATKAWGFNELGYLEELPSGCAFFGGARLVRNTVRTTSEDFSNAAWSKINLTVTGTNVIVCANATSAQYINQSAGGTSLTAGTRMAYSYRVKRVVGGVDFLQISPTSTTYGSSQFVNVSLVDGSYAATGCSAAVTAVSADTFDVTIFPTVTVTGGDICSVAMINAITDVRLPSFIGDGIKSFELLRAWSVDVTNYNVSYVPEYVSVGVVASPYFGAGIDGAKYFETDWQGAPIAAASLLGLRREAAATNNLLQSRLFQSNVWTSSPTGSELCVNGDFGASTGWTAEAGWAIGSGVLTGTATSANTYRFAGMVSGKTYTVSFEVVSRTAGLVAVTVGNQPVAVWRSSAGVYTYNVIGGASGNIEVKSSGFSGVVDNVSVKEAAVQCTQATGLDGIANTATTLTATAADAIILQPITLASAARCASAYVKRRTGTGTISFTQDGTNWTDITSQINSSTWSRVQITSTLANPSTGFKISTSGDAIDVDCAQNEAGAVATSPIITTTAAVTRNADSLTYQTASNIDFAVGTVFCEISSYSYLSTRIALEVGASGWSYIHAADANTVWKAYDGTNLAAKSGLSDISTAKRKRVVSWGTGLKVTGDGLTPASGSFDGSFGTGATMSVGKDINGYISSVAIYNYQMTDAELQAITS